MKVEIGDLVEDRHYGLGTVESVGHQDPTGEDWVRAFFPQFPHLAPGGFIRLYGGLAKELKIISKSEKSFE